MILLVEIGPVVPGKILKFLQRFFAFPLLFTLGKGRTLHLNKIVRTRNIFFCKELCRAYDILSRAHDILSRAHDLLSRAHDIISRAHDLIIILVHFARHLHRCKQDQQ